MKMMKLRSFVLAAFLLVSLPLASSYAQVGFSVNFAPPPLPVFEQPACPVAGYIWTPGYWGWGEGDYYWVPGVWVPPPSIGLLWTPAWWGWNNGAYVFNQGYWGPTVGFYGGVNYGYGYTGNGYWGGRWNGNTFNYNTAVTRVNTNVIHNTYVNNSVTNNMNVNRASFNGPNGVNAQETAAQKAAGANAKKVGPTSQQLERQQAAGKDNNLKASVSKGNPNADAIKSFNQGQGKGIGELNHPSTVYMENKGTESKLQGAGEGNAGNKVGAGNQLNKQRNLEGNQAKMHSGKMAGTGGAANGPHGMNKMSHNPQMGARNAQMGGKHPQMGGGGKHPQTGGGNRPKQGGGQQQGKKKGDH